MRIIIKTKYMFDDAEDWIEKVGGLKSYISKNEIEDIITNDEFPNVPFVSINGKITAKGKTWVEYQIIREVDASNEEIIKIIEWQKNECNDSQIIIQTNPTF